MSNDTRTPTEPTKSRFRKFRGVEYLHCDEFTEEEMAVIVDWDSATHEQKHEICVKYGWGGFYCQQVPERPQIGHGLLFKCHVHVRLADVDRTIEWRAVIAHSLEQAVKFAERMPDVEVCLEASFVPGGVVT